MTNKGSKEEALQVLKSIKNKVKLARSIMSDTRVQATLKLTNSLAESLVEYTDSDRTLLNKFNLLSKFGSEITTMLFEMDSYEYFNNSDWEVLFNESFFDILRPILNRFESRHFKYNEDTITLYDVNGTNIGHYSGHDTVIFCQTSIGNDGVQKLREHLFSLLWEKYKGINSLSLRVKNNSNSGDDSPRSDQSFILEPDNIYVPLPSKFAAGLAQTYKKYIDAGIHRSVLIYGPPGSGKSTASIAIINELKLRSMRLSLNDAYVSSDMIFSMVALFKPDIIIIDDFDRTQLSTSDKILQLLERIKKHTKLFIATANNITTIDDAMLRPGRFDEIEKLDTLDESVVRHVLGQDASPHIFELVKSWPIVFIEEYVKRRTVLGEEEAIKSITRLAKRAEKIMTTSDRNNESWNSIIENESEKEDDEEDAEDE